MQTDPEQIHATTRILTDRGLVPPLEVLWALLSVTRGEEPVAVVSQVAPDTVESWRVIALTAQLVIEVKGTVRQTGPRSQIRHSDDAKATVRLRAHVASLEVVPTPDWSDSIARWTTAWRVTFEDGTSIDLPAGEDEKERASDKVAVELLKSPS